MKKIIIFLSFFVILFSQDKPIYDPTLNPFKQLNKAAIEAKKDNKNILMIVGGDWCPWCRRIAKLIEEDNEIKNAISNYVVIKIHYSKQNKNTEFLSNFPKIDGYPHIFILDKNKKLIHSQNTGELESDGGYDKEKFLTFLKKFSKGSQ
jgi:thioredoxin-related protein